MTSSISLLARGAALWQRAVTLLEALQPLALLAARAYVFQVFFFSGLLKLQHWDTTLSLFSDYYQVPLLPPTLAAVMGAGGELLFSSLLLAGLAGRPAAIGLFVVNLFAFLSLPVADLSDPIRMQHAFWGSLLTGLALWGPGGISIDGLIGRWRVRREPAVLQPR